MKPVLRSKHRPDIALTCGLICDNEPEQGQPECDKRCFEALDSLVEDMVADLRSRDLNKVVGLVFHPDHLEVICADALSEDAESSIKDAWADIHEDHDVEFD